MARNKKTTMELNLVPLPLYQFSRGKHALVVEEGNSKSITVPVGRKGSVKLTFTEGIPTKLAQDTIFYLFTKIPLNYEGRQAKPVVDIKSLKKDGIKYTLGEICDGLGLAKNGKNKRRIKEELIKMGGIALTYHESYKKKKDEKELDYETVRTNGLFWVELWEDKKDGVKDYESTIKFEDSFVDNLENSFFRLYDYNFYKSLDTGVTKRLYTLLLPHNQSDSWSCGVEKLSDKIPLFAKELKEKKRTIKNSLVQLKKERFLKKFSFYKNELDEEIIEFEFP